MGDELIRAAALNNPVPELGPTPFLPAPKLASARVAIVTTAALHAPGEPPAKGGDPSFRVVSAATELVLGHESPNFDRAGWLQDTNVIFPLERLAELARDQVIGSVAARHLAFAGNQQNDTLATVGLDSGPAAAKLLREDSVDVVLLTPV